MKSNSKEQIEGYKEHIKEIEVLRKYGVERTLEKGQVLDAINTLHPKSIDLKVSRVIKETHTTSTLRLVPKNGYLPPFQAGQYINLFMDMIREVTGRGLDRQIHLIYGSRKEDDIVFHEELADRSSYADQIKLSHVISEPSPEYSGAKGFIFYMFRPRYLAAKNSHIF
jgi:ferredoxin-NADP reductase